MTTAPQRMDVAGAADSGGVETNGLLFEQRPTAQAEAPLGQWSIFMLLALVVAARRIEVTIRNILALCRAGQVRIGYHLARRWIRRIRCGGRVDWRRRRGTVRFRIVVTDVVGTGRVVRHRGAGQNKGQRGETGSDHCDDHAFLHVPQSVGIGAPRVMANEPRIAQNGTPWGLSRKPTRVRSADIGRTTTTAAETHPRPTL